MEGYGDGGEPAGHRGGRALWLDIREAFEVGNIERQAEDESAESFFRLGEMSARNSSKDTSGIYYEEAYSRFTGLVAAEPNRLDTKKGLVLTLDALGQVYSDRGEWNRAVAAYQEGKTICVGLAKADPGNPEYWMARGVFEMKLGRLCHLFGKTDQAKDAFLSARKLLEQCNKWVPGVSAIPDRFAQVDLDLGVLSNETGNPEEALDYFTKAVATWEVQEIEDPRKRAENKQHGLSKAYMNIGLCQFELGKADAFTNIDKGMCIAEQLVLEFPEVIAYHAALAMDLYNTGGCYLKTKRFDSAEKNYTRARQILKRLIRDHSTVLDYRSAMGITNIGLGVTYYETNRPNDAFAAYSEAIGAFACLAEKYPDVAKYHTWLANSHARLGVIHNLTVKFAPGENPRDRGTVVAKFTPAENAIKKSIALGEEVCRRFPGAIKYRLQLSGYYCDLIVVRRNMGVSDSAVDPYTKARTILDALAQSDPDSISARTKLAECCCTIAESMERAGQLQRELEWFTRAVDTLGPVLLRNDLANASNDLAKTVWTACLGRAKVLVKLGRYAEGVKEVERIGIAPITLYSKVCVLALASSLIRKDVTISAANREIQAEAFASEAVRLLEKGYSSGYYERLEQADIIRNDSDLDPLRSRSDFQALAKRLRSR